MLFLTLIFYKAVECAVSAAATNAVSFTDAILQKVCPFAASGQLVVAYPIQTFFFIVGVISFARKAKQSRPKQSRPWVPILETDPLFGPRLGLLSTHKCRRPSCLAVEK